MASKRIKLLEYDPSKHDWDGSYISSRGIELQSPSLREDMRARNGYLYCYSCKIEKLIETLKKDSKVKAHFLIDTRSRGGADSDWYRLSMIRIRVWEI